MLLTLQRETATEHSTPGSLAVNWIPECLTLERPPAITLENQIFVCIPAGTYQVTIAHSNRFGRLMPLLEGVPGRTAIEIHMGNVPQDTEGCIIVGTYAPNRDFVSFSVMAFGKLYGKLQTAFNAKEEITIEVRNH